MAALTLDLGCGDYDIVRPLKDGLVRAEGMEINFITINRPPEVHWRMGVHHEFDAVEMSFGSFIAGKARGDFPFVGIPAFVYRKFRHSCAYVNVNAGIDKPEDLKGKRVGVPEWQMTATVWLRGFIQDDYDVRPRDINWFAGGLESSERKEKVPLTLPLRSKLRISPRKKSLGHVDCGRGGCIAHGAGAGAFRQVCAAGAPAIRRPAGSRSRSLPAHRHISDHAGAGRSRRILSAPSLGRPKSLQSIA